VEEAVVALVFVHLLGGWLAYGYVRYGKVALEEHFSEDIIVVS
jgi:hypothetical protein